MNDMKIAIPLSDENFEEYLEIASNEGADIIEIRVDLFENRDPEFIKEKIESVHKKGLETILTIRSEREGGKRVEGREKLFGYLSPLSDYTDIELSSTNLLGFVRQIVKSSGKKLIVSLHDFKSTPPGWLIGEYLREMYRWGADIAKIAVTPQTGEDVARLLCFSRRVSGKKIIIAMGDKGKVTRVAGYIFDSVITYSFVGRATAPGQIPLKEMVYIRNLLYDGQG